MAGDSEAKCLRADLIKSGKYSDLTITCKWRVFKVHKIIVCPRSSFFAKACDGNFLESLTNNIELRDDDISTVERMLCFLYTGNYHDEGQDPSSDVVPIDVEQIIKMDVQPSVNASLILVTLSAASQRHTPPNPREKITVDANTLLNNVSVYAIADKYDVPELKELAICKFKTRCVGHWNDDVITTIAKAVYESTPANDRALRDQMVRICHIYAYRINKYLPFRSLLSENGEIALELLDVTLASLKRRDTFLSQVAELMKWQRNRLRSSEGG